MRIYSNLCFNKPLLKRNCFLFLLVIMPVFIPTIHAKTNDSFAVKENTSNEKYEELSDQIDSFLEELHSQSEELSRIKIHGDATIRFKNTTHSKVSKPLGPYGESLTKGLKLNHRMKLELEARLSENLFAGGMIRLSNEDQIVFDTGPERLSSDRGSVFIKYNLDKFRWTLGYYNAHFTPLTLMRWDMEDNPEGGGASRCAVCPSEGGAITAESLEKLGPDFTFEGSKMSADLNDNVNITAIIARPRIAQERKTFQQFLYGANTKLISYHKPSMSFRSLGFTAIYIQDDEKSVLLPTKVLYSPVKDKVFGADFNLPIGKPIMLKGEVAYSRLVEKISESHIEESSGNATMVSMLIKYPYRLSSAFSYLRISPKYKSIYNALSYSSNNQGFRISSNYDIIKDRFSTWIFYKRLKELESSVENAPELLKTDSIISLGTSITIIKGLLLNVSYIFESFQREGNKDVEKLDKLMNNINVELIHNFSKDADLSIKYQYVKNDDKVKEELSHHANIISVMMSASF